MAKRYSPRFKFQVVMELLEGDKSVAQVAKAYGVHPNTVHNWKQQLQDNGPAATASAVHCHVFNVNPVPEVHKNHKGSRCRFLRSPP